MPTDKQGKLHNTILIIGILLIGISFIRPVDAEPKPMILSPYGDKALSGQVAIQQTDALGGVLSVWNLSAGNNRYKTPDKVKSSHPAIERTNDLVFTGWFVDPEDPDNPDLRDGYFACSEDGGKTFSIGKKFGSFDLKDPTRDDVNFLSITSNKAASYARYFVAAKDGIWQSASLVNTTVCSLSSATRIYSLDTASHPGVYTDNISVISTDLAKPDGTPISTYAIAFNEAYTTDVVNNANDDATDPLDSRLRFLVSYDAGTSWAFDRNDLYHDTDPSASFDGVKLTHMPKSSTEEYVYLGFVDNGDVYIDEGVWVAGDLSWNTEALGSPLIGFPSGTSNAVSFDLKVGVDSDEVFLLVHTEGLDTEGVEGFAPDQIRMEVFSIGNFPSESYTLASPTSVLSTILEETYYGETWSWEEESASDLDYVGLTSTPQYFDQVKGVILDAGVLDGDPKVLLYDTYDNSFMTADMYDPGLITSFSGKPKAVSYPSHPACATGGFVFAYTVETMTDPAGVEHTTPEVIAGSYCLP